MLELLLGLFVGFGIGINIGLHIEKIFKKVQDIYDRDPEPPAQVVTPKRPGYSDVNEFSSIVTPKTPDQIEREEQERVRNI